MAEMGKSMNYSTEKLTVILEEWKPNDGEKFLKKCLIVVHGAIVMIALGEYTGNNNFYGHFTAYESNLSDSGSLAEFTRNEINQLLGISIAAYSDSQGSDLDEEEAIDEYDYAVEQGKKYGEVIEL